MQGEITIHTGGQDDYFKVYVKWSDHNNVAHQDEVEIRIGHNDKPRTLELWFNGELLATKDSRMEEGIKPGQAIKVPKRFWEIPD